MRSVLRCFFTLSRRSSLGAACGWRIFSSVPNARGRGIGKALLRRLAGIAAERGCGRFEWSVLDWNTPAIRFYEGLGAQVMPDWRIARVTGAGIGRLAEGRDEPS